ncbi:hypothetical protein [Salinicoccus albus]|nr:hypothetical protein [Salinicoccus albus]
MSEAGVFGEAAFGADVGHCGADNVHQTLVPHRKPASNLEAGIN